MLIPSCLIVGLFLSKLQVYVTRLEIRGTLPPTQGTSPCDCMEYARTRSYHLLKEGRRVSAEVSGENAQSRVGGVGQRLLRLETASSQYLRMRGEGTRKIILRKILVNVLVMFILE